MKNGKLMDDILGAKFGTKNRANLIQRTERLAKAVEDIIWMARRYANERMTGAPSTFNDAYDILREELGDDIDRNRAMSADTTYYDIAIESSKDHPYANYGSDREDAEDNRQLVNRKFYKKP